MAAKRIEKADVRKKFLVDLTDDELKDRAERAADIESELTKKKEQYGLIRREQNKKVKEMESEIHQCLSEYRTKKVTKELDAVEERDFSKGEIRWKVNGKIIDKRDMRDDEMQTDLTADTKEKKKSSNKKPSEIVKDAKAKAVADVHKEETSRKTKKSSVDPSNVTQISANA